MGEGIGLLIQQLRGLGDDGGPLSVGLVAPGFVAGLRFGDLGLELRVGYIIEGFDQLSVERVDCLVAHEIAFVLPIAPMT